MEKLIDIFLHLNKHIEGVAEEYKHWLYLILFLIIFCETALVVMPFLPGDSLLFAAGALFAAPNSAFNVHLTFFMLVFAAIVGDAVNYSIGKYVGPRVFRSDTSWLFNKKHLIRTQEFYEKYGGKTIFIARFIPIIRTFAPFVAGIGSMRYARFAMYNVTGGITWVGFFLYLGYIIGREPVVQNNFSIIVVLIILISVAPLAIEFYMARRRASMGKSEMPVGIGSERDSTV
jgi:membrane-associated protein